jgi:hypothetical protein
MNKQPVGLKTIAKREWEAKQARLRAEQAALIKAKNAAFLKTIGGK